MNQPAPHCYEFGPFRLDVVKRLLWRDGEIVPLKPKAFETLLVLVARHGQVLGKEELMRQLWPDSFVEDGNLSVNIFALRRALGETPDEHRYIVTMPGRGYSFVASVRELCDEDEELSVRESVIIEEEEAHREQDDAHPSERLSPATQSPTLPPPLTALRDELEPVGGAVPLDSPFYIARPADAEFQAAVARQDSIVLVKGARQVGKTSLLARSLQRAREAGTKVVLTDFQSLNASHLESINALFLMLAKLAAKQLDLKVLPQQVWDADLGPSMNLASYVEREVLGQIAAPLVWGLDQLPRIEIRGLSLPFVSHRSLRCGLQMRKVKLKAG